MNKKLNFQIDGIHCRACKTLIENDLKKHNGIENIYVDHQSGASSVEYDENKTSLDEIFTTIKKLNYYPREKNSPSSKNKYRPIIFLALIFLIAALGYISIDILGGFSLLEKLNDKNISYSLILLLGFFAGFHCVGMCGAFVLTYSTKEATKKRKAWAPHLEYNLGRLISYSLIGGILGGLGSFFGVNLIFTSTITLLASLVMIMMGVSFLTNWSFAKKFQIPLPDFMARYIYRQKSAKKSKGPFLIGLLTGFMPCGPLQAVELYALTSGSAIRGALSMGIYALGTTIVLFIFGLSISSLSKKYLEKIIKVSGVFIIILGILMVFRALEGFNFSSNQNAEKNIQKEIFSEKDFQEVTMTIDNFGYDPGKIILKENKPVRWNVKVIRMSACTNTIEIPSLGIRRRLKYGDNFIEFNIPEGVKEIKFSCGMKMIWGKFIIEQKSTNTSNNEVNEAGATCGLTPTSCNQ